MAQWPESIEALAAELAALGYLADDALASVAFVACRLGRPLFLEGEPGVGKTELAKALAAAAGTELIRLQCYEGIDVGQALYDWNFRRQVLHLQSGAGTAEHALDVFDASFLVERPVLRALRHAGPRPAVLLIDEIDRADEAFEAFLLEALADSAVTIPELGTVRAVQPPWVVITSNRTRELHDATKRRCLYHWLDWPSVDREAEIVRARVPEAPHQLVWQLCQAVQRLRRMDLYKSPGIAETLDWARTVLALGRKQLDLATARRSVGAVIKNELDYKRLVEADLAGLLADEIA